MQRPASHRHKADGEQFDRLIRERPGLNKSGATPARSRYGWRPFAACEGLARDVASNATCPESSAKDAIMADPISVQCPHCKVKLKLKAAPPAGKKVGCPKCKKPFPVKAPPKKKESDDDFLDALDDLAEDDYEAPEDEDSQDEKEDRPARSTIRSKSGGATKKTGKGKKGRSKKSSAGLLLAIIGGSVAALVLVGGLVYLLMNLSSGGKGIRSASGEFIAFVPSDADTFVAARPADILALPLMGALNQNPQVKLGLAQFETQFGFPLTEIDHVFAAVKTNSAGAGGAAQGAPAAGNPMMGPPPGMMPGMPGAPGGGGNRSPVQDGVVVLRLKQPYGGKTLEQISQAAPTRSYKGVNYHVANGPNAGGFFFGDDRHVVMGEPSQMERIIDRKDQAEDAKLLTYFAKDQHITVVGTPSGMGMQGSLTPGLNPALMRNDNVQKMMQDIATVRLDVNMPGSIDLKVAVTCKSDAGAQQLHTETTKLIGQAKQQSVVLALMVPGADSVLNSMQANLSGSTMNVSASVPSDVVDKLKKMGEQQVGGGSPGNANTPNITVTPTTAPTETSSDNNSLASVQAAVSLTQARNNLKQVLLAFHNHHDIHKTFPQAYSVDANGQPLLSWRVHILPFLGKKELYDQFHLNEPWDSEHNKSLIPQIPDTYSGTDTPELTSQGRTRIVVPTGPGMAFEGKDPIHLRDFLDGTSNTVMAVEVASSAAVIWTKPDDLIVDVNMPHQSLQGSRGDSFSVAFADGSAKTLKSTIAADVLKALFTRKAGDLIPINAF